MTPGDIKRFDQALRNINEGLGEDHEMWLREAVAEKLSQLKFHSPADKERARKQLLAQVGLK